MAVTTALKRRALRRAYRAAQAAHRSLLLQLETDFDAADAAVQHGSFVTASAAGGVSSSWATDRDVTPSNAADASEQLLSLYEKVVAYTTTGDAAVFAEMLLLLVPATEIRADWSASRQW